MESFERGFVGRFELGERVWVDGDAVDAGCGFCHGLEERASKSEHDELACLARGMGLGNEVVVDGVSKSS